MPIRNFADVQASEAEPLARRALPRSTYDALAASAKRWPDAKALSFFLTADTYEHTVTWTYADLLVDVARAANLLHELGVDADHPVAFVLPNLPETHFAIWGGEAAGVVLAINPLFEPLQIRELLRATHARVLVTLAPSPESDLWARLVPQLSDLPDLKVVATVDLSAYLPNRAVAAPIRCYPGSKPSLFATQCSPSPPIVWSRRGRSPKEQGRPISAPAAPSKDGRQDRRGLWSHRGRVRVFGQPVLWREACWLDRHTPSLPTDACNNS